MMLHNSNHYPRYHWDNQPQQPSYFYRPEEEYYRNNLGENTQYHYYEDERRARSNKPTNRYNKNSTTTTNKKKKKSQRSRSFSGQKQYNHRFNYNSSEEEEENNENEFNQYHRLNGVRSVSPPNHHQHFSLLNRQMVEEDNNRRRRSWVQPFVNLRGAAPMINPMTFPQQSLGVCTTDNNTWLNMTTNAFGPPTNDVIFLPQATATVPMIHQPPPFFIQPQQHNNNFIGYYPQQQQPMFPPRNFVQQMPNLHPDLFSSSSQQTNTDSSSASNSLLLNEIENKAAASAAITATSSSGPTSPLINKDAVPSAADVVVVPAPTTQKPVLLQRKKSIMEGILSSFSLLGESNNTSAVNHQGNGGGIIDTSSSSNNCSTTATTTWDPSSYTSLSEAVAKVDGMPADANKVTDQQEGEVVENSSSSAGLSRKTSLKLFQKANALQNRQYIWCYRPFQQVVESDVKKEGSAATLWAAFDIKNQTKLDNQCSLMMAKKAHQRYGGGLGTQPRQLPNKPPQVTTDDHILTINKQSKLTSPVMISLHDGVVWYYHNNNASDYTLLEIACMPTQSNKLVVSNEIMEEKEGEQQQEEYYSLPRQQQQSKLRRSKSIDGLASKLLNTVLRW